MKKIMSWFFTYIFDTPYALLALFFGISLGFIQHKYSDYKNNTLYNQCVESHNIVMDFSQSNNPPSVPYVPKELINKEFPIKFYVNKQNTTLQEFKAIKYAGNVWNKAFGKKVFIFEYVNDQLTLNKDNKNVIMFLKDWEADKSSEQARTSTNYLNSFIVESDIRINLQNFRYYTLDEKNKHPELYQSQYNLESLVIHELGHVLGLKHYHESVMYTFLMADLNRVSLTKNDLSVLGCKYPQFKNNLNKELAKINNSETFVTENSSLSSPLTIFNQKGK